MPENKRKKKPVRYSDLSPLKRAWAGLWNTPTYTKEEVIELNKDFINGFSKKNDKKVAKEYSMTVSLQDLKFAKEMSEKIPKALNDVQIAYDLLKNHQNFVVVNKALESCEKAILDLDEGLNWYSKIVNEGAISND